MSSNFEGPIASAIWPEATLRCVTLSNPINEAFSSKRIRLESEFSIDYASCLINSATAMLGLSFAPKKSFMSVYV